MRQRSREGRNIPFFTTSLDALSLATYKGRKVERNKGTRAKEENIERGEWCQRGSPMSRCPHLTLPQEPWSCSPSPNSLPRLFKRKVYESTPSIKHQRRNNPNKPTVLHQHRLLRNKKSKPANLSGPITRRKV